MVVHEQQVEIGRAQVVALIADQIPSLAGLEVVAVSSVGTDNSIYRIGDEVTARFPLRRTDPDVERGRLRIERSAAAEFRAASPVAAPEPLHLGEPGHGYPMPWSTQTWLPGATATPSGCEDSTSLACDLAHLVGRLRDWDVGVRRFDGEGRGGVLADHDDWIDECIRRSVDLLDPDVMRRVWAGCRQLPRHDPDRLCHTDLIPFNLLVVDGRLVGVLDAGGCRPADPALDLVAAWHLLADAPRERLRRDLGCSDLEWERGRAWAFQQAIGAYWYYERTNASMAEMGRTTLERIIATG